MQGFATFPPSHVVAFSHTMVAWHAINADYIYEASGAFHVRYYVKEIVEGKPVKKQRSHKLCDKDRGTGHGSPAAMAVRSLCEDFMRTINERERTRNTWHRI